MQKNVKFKQSPENKIQKDSQDKHSEEKSIIHTLLDEYNKELVKQKANETDKHSEETSVIRTLLNEYNKGSVKVVEVDKHSEKKSIMQTLVNEYNKQPVKIVEDSISRKLLNSVKATRQDKEKRVRYCKKYN